MGGDGGVLVYDEFDIWRLDLSGKLPPINITNRYGRHHHTKLRLADYDRSDKTGIPSETTLLLKSFNTENKYNGFYRVNINARIDPELLTMGPWTMDHTGTGVFMPTNSHDFNIGMPPVKTGKGWIVRRSTATEAPNYYLTDNNFKTYKPLTEINPQSGYNWLTTELINYRQLDGQMSQGVLYKPEDFDPQKKYPLILNYYQKLSHRLYEYPIPELSSNEINIPWFVSRGYLVFTTDMNYQGLGKMGEITLNAVEGAAICLSKFPYVDSMRMGINGHSQGGAETNYLVTHTHMFAAAISGSAGHNGADLISTAFSFLVSSDGTVLDRCENDDMGASLWERPDLWIENSPIFCANQVTTPLLMLNNKKDDMWVHNLELFIALRRLGKKVWMLQYDKGNHSLHGKDPEDFTKRIQQFFDHYLKGALAPKWMTEGVPAKLKGIETGLELDHSGKKP